MFSVAGTLPLVEYCALIFLAVIAFRRFGVWALPFTWTALSAIRIFANGDNPYKDSSRLWIESFNSASASSLAGGLLALAAVEAFSVATWLYGFQIIILINAALLLGPYTGICLNESMSGCLNVCALPIFFDRRGRVPLLSLGLILLSVFAARQSQPIALLFIALGLQLVLEKRFKALFLALISSLGVGFLVAGRMLFDSSGRVELWQIAGRFWNEYFQSLIGAGLGTFSVLGPEMTIGRPGFHSGFLWLHSELFQILFEQGIVGLIFALFAYVATLIRARRDPRLLTCFVLYGCFCLANFPLHSPFSAFFGVLLIKWALQPRTATLPAKKNRRHSNCPA